MNQHKVDIPTYVSGLFDRAKGRVLTSLSESDLDEVLIREIVSMIDRELTDMHLLVRRLTRIRNSDIKWE